MRESKTITQLKKRAMSADWSGLRVALCARCSTDDQAHGDYTTVDSQLSTCRKYVAERRGIVTLEATDEGVSGTILNRPGWRTVRGAAETGGIDIVVCTFMSRLGRGDVYVLAENTLKQYGVLVVTCVEAWGDDHNIDVYARKKVGNFLDGMYPIQVRAWTMARLGEMFDSGYHVGGGVAFGYKTVAAWEASDPHAKKQPPRLVVPDEGEAEFVALAFAAALAEASVGAASAYLSRVTGTAWSWSRANHLLRNRAYLGEYHWNGRTRNVAKNHAALVPLDLFDAVQNMLGAGRGVRQRRAVAKVPMVSPVVAPVIAQANPIGDTTGATATDSPVPGYWFHGLVYCGHCENGGAPYRMSNAWASGRNGRVSYYECVWSRKYASAQKKAAVKVAGNTDTFSTTPALVPSCPVARVNADRLHQAIADEVLLMAEHPWRVRKHIERALPHLPNAQSLEAQFAAVRMRLAQAERELGNLTGAVAISGASVIAALAARISETETRRAALDAELKRLGAELLAAKAQFPTVAQITETLSLFRQIWDNRTDAERGELLALLVERIVMESKTVARVTLAPIFAEPLHLPDFSSDLASGSNDEKEGATVQEAGVVVRGLGGSCEVPNKGGWQRFTRTKPSSLLSSVPSIIPAPRVRPLEILVRTGRPGTKIRQSVHEVAK